MTTGVGKVLVTRKIQRRGRSVLVTVGAPQPFSSTDSSYVCRLRIEGLQPGPMMIRATGNQPVQALLSGLGEVSSRLSVTLPDFLSDAHIGGDLTPLRA
ncbi:DUF6968 family protein [Nocardia sp. NPDC004278]|uniref:DUF6968 family protein n=1 Tax=unclassified Nocardia TaxID=2637762 RepID=UPI00339F603F